MNMEKVKHHGGKKHQAGTTIFPRKRLIRFLSIQGTIFKSKGHIDERITKVTRSAETATMSIRIVIFDIGPPQQMSIQDVMKIVYRGKTNGSFSNFETGADSTPIFEDDNEILRFYKHGNS